MNVYVKYNKTSFFKNGRSLGGTSILCEGQWECQFWWTETIVKLVYYHDEKLCWKFHKFVLNDFENDKLDFDWDFLMT